MAKKEEPKMTKRESAIARLYTPQTKVTLKKGEENYICAELVMHEIDMESGLAKFKPYIQYFDPRGWKQFLKYPNGLEVLKVHNLPKGAITVADFKSEQSKVKPRN